MRSPVRRRKGDVQLAAITFSSPVRKPITVIGMIHMADPDFYHQVASLVKHHQAQGAVVHYELTDEAPEADMAALPRELVMAVAEIKRKGEERKARGAARISEMLGLTTQHEALYEPYKDSWENHDLNMAQFALYLGVNRLKSLLDSFEKLASLADEKDETIRKVGAWVLLFGIRHIRVAMAIQSLIALVRSDTATRRVVLEMRNSVAAHAALKAAEDVPVVLVWGAGHVPGIAAILGEYLYRPTGTRWLTALRKTRG